MSFYDHEMSALLQTSLHTGGSEVASEEVRSIASAGGVTDCCADGPEASYDYNFGIDGDGPALPPLFVFLLPPEYFFCQLYPLHQALS